MNDEFSRNYQSLYSEYSVKEEEIREYLKEKTRLIQSDALSRTALPTHADWLIISGLPFKRASRKSGIKIEPNILYKN